MSSERQPTPKLTCRGTSAVLGHQCMQGEAYSTPVPRPGTSSQPFLGHVPLWESDKCSDFANHFGEFIDVDGWSSFIHSLIYALKQARIRGIIKYQARRINTTVGKHGSFPQGDHGLWEQTEKKEI